MRCPVSCGGPGRARTYDQRIMRSSPTSDQPLEIKGRPLKIHARGEIYALVGTCRNGRELPRIIVEQLERGALKRQFPRVINTTFKPALYQMVLHRPVEPAAQSGNLPGAHMRFVVRPCGNRNRMP